jgi:hypothetical protein
MTAPDKVTDNVMDVFITSTLSCLEHARVVRFGRAGFSYEMNDDKVRFAFRACVKFDKEKNENKKEKKRRWWQWGIEHSDDENVIAGDEVAADLVDAARSCLRHARAAQFGDAVTNYLTWDGNTQWSISLSVGYASLAIPRPQEEPEQTE